MSNGEAFARVRIDSMLRQSGWRLESKAGMPSNVALEGDIRDPRIKSNLQQSRPDYHLYPENSNTPIAFIEAKKPGNTLDIALGQATEYARRGAGSSSPRMIVIASDGIQVRTRHANGSALTLNGAIIDFIPSPNLLIALIDEPSLNRGDVVSHADSLIRIFKNAGDSMRADGIDQGIESLREFCTLLFIKIMSERGDLISREIWDSLKKTTGRSLLQRYRDSLSNYRNKYGEIFPESNIRRPETVEYIRNQLDDINFTSTDVDVKGEAFEYFLRRYNSGRTSVLGQYFTPRHIARFLAAILNPEQGDKVLDPFCGTGGMLIMCYHHMRRTIKNTDEKTGTQQLKLLQEASIYGRDISNGASSLAKMNMVLIGDGHTNIINGDSLSELELRKYNKVITNIPFNIRDGGHGSSHRSSEIYTRHSGIHNPDYNEMCLIHCILSVAPGGRAALIIPETICYLDRYTKLREWIASTSRIESVFRLHGHVFTPYTTARTAILLLSNIHQRQSSDFPALSVDNDGYSLDTNREPINENDLPLLLEFSTERRLHEYPRCQMVRLAKNENYKFFDQDTAISIRPGLDYWKLSELVNVRSDKEILIADQLYVQPSLDSITNTVSPRGKPRLGQNIKGAEKVITQLGDIIIGTLHTQQNNGLFAIADREYVTTSQLVVRNKEIVSTGYLFAMLRILLPTLSTSDLVGRETYKASTILALRIPKPTPAIAEAIRPIVNAINDILLARKELEYHTPDLKKLIF